MFFFLILDANGDCPVSANRVKANWAKQRRRRLIAAAAGAAGGPPPPPGPPPRRPPTTNSRRCSANRRATRNSRSVSLSLSLFLSLCLIFLPFCFVLWPLIRSSHRSQIEFHVSSVKPLLAGPLSFFSHRAVVKNLFAHSLFDLPLVFVL